MATLTDTLERAARQAGNIVDRALDRQVRLAVTGLSGSGKTAFITALVNQLEHACTDARLPLWGTAREQRLLGARRVPQLNPHIPSFPYLQGMEAFTAAPPRWPEPTRGVAEIRLEIRYRPGGALRRRLGRVATLHLDIIDYPGEWLLDLPLLDLDYATWSAEVRAVLDANPALGRRAARWCEPAQDPDQAFDEQRVAALAGAYTDYLHACRDELGLNLIQPGRFVLPGEYAGAPLLQFVPWVWAMPAAAPANGSLYAVLAQRYEQYKQHIVRDFYQRHFAGFDRQIVLVDCLQALDSGREGFEDVRASIARIMQSFAYGESNWWRRLFAPRIDRLLFVASKADHVTPDQHANLVSLLQHIVQSARGQANFDGILTDCMALASVCSTEVRSGRYRGENVTGIRGHTLDGEPLFVFPGSVPARIPEPLWWDARSTRFDRFRPPALTSGSALPHIRLDAALDFLLDDKLR